MSCCSSVYFPIESIEFAAGLMPFAIERSNLCAGGGVIAARRLMLLASLFQPIGGFVKSALDLVAFGLQGDAAARAAPGVRFRVR